MSGPGRSPEVSDLELLREAALIPDPVFTATEIAERIDLTQQAVDSRLRKLEDDLLVHSRKKGQARVWWLSQSGREFVAGDDQ